MDLLDPLGLKAKREARYKEAVAFNPEKVIETDWCSEEEASDAGLFVPRGLPLGYYKGRPIYYPGTIHGLTFGSSGSGKTTSQLIPAILSDTMKDTSMVIFDLMGELSAVTGAWRRKFGPVHVINPMELFGDTYLKRFRPFARYNVMDRSWLDPCASSFGTRAAKIAASCILSEHERDKYFILTARALAQGIIMTEARHGVPNLARVGEIITGDINDYCRWAVNTTTDPFIKRILKRFAAEGADEIRSLNEAIETARTEFAFLCDEAICNCVSESDFSFADLKREVRTVYIVLPLEVIEVLGKFNSLLLGSALGELLRGAI